MRKLSTLLLCALCALAIFLTSCSVLAIGPAPTPTPLPPVVSYEKAVFTVTRGPIIQETSFQAVVVPQKQDDLFFRASGFITRVLVKDGDAVKEGDLLAELQVDDLLNQLEQAQIDLEVARAALEKDKVQRQYNIQRAQIDVAIWEKRLELARLEVEGAIGETARARAQLNYDITAQNLELARIALQEASQQVTSYEEQAVQRSQLAVQRLESLIAERRIFAPYDGVILRVDVKPGRQIEAYAVAVRLGDPSRLVLRASYDYELSQKLRQNVPVRIEIPTNTEEKEIYPVTYLPNFIPISSAEGAVSTSIVTDWLYFSLPTEIAPEKLPIGQSVTMVVTIGKKDDALLLPPAAIRSYGGNSFVIVLEGERRRRVEISEFGLRTPSMVEVIADLNEGDQVLGP